jgi:regulator of microtubule dynamics protein 3
MKKYLLILFVMATVVANAQSVSELMAQGAKLEEERNESAALFKYKEALKQEPNNHKILCKVSWLSARIGFRVADVNKKREYYNAALEYAKKAEQIKSENAESHYVLALAYGRLAEISSPKERVTALKDIQTHASKCVQIDPNHAGGYHLLGRLNHRVANLSSAETAAANLLLGGVPKGMTNEKAVAYFKKAASLRPEYILYWKDLAVALADVGEKDACKAALKKAIDLPILTEDDPGYKLSCKSMLNNLQ